MEHYDFWRRRSRKEQTRGKTTATTVSINTFQASNRRIDIRYVIRTCCRIVTCPRYSRFQRILYQRYPEPRVMQTRKIVIASLSLLIVGLALPAVSLPPANAFHNGTIAVTVGGILRNVQDPATGFVNAAQAGSTITVNFVIQGSNFTPTYQRNVTFGFKGDWMNSYQNVSGSATTPVQSNQVGSGTISVSIPAAGQGPGSPAHTWTVAVWDGPANAFVGVSCPSGDAEKAPACVTVNNPGPALTFYTADQFNGLQNRQLFTTTSGFSTSGNPTAAGQVAQANSELALGDNSWRNGDYAGAKGHYQNALNDLNAAEQSLVNLGGGSANASIVQQLLQGAGYAMFGFGGLLGGIGGFFYLRRKPKA